MIEGHSENLGNSGRGGVAFEALHRAGLETDHTVTRPLSPADCHAFRAFAARLNPEDVRLRFAGPVKLTDQPCVRFLAIDRDREEAFGAFDAVGNLLGVGRIVRLSAAEADIALIVRSDLKRRGLGMALMNRIVAHARSIGLKAIRGDVLHENLPMRLLAKRAGFHFVGVGGLMTEIRLELHQEAGWSGFGAPEGDLAH